MRGCIYNYVKAFKQHHSLENNLAIDISFGSVGFARVLARPFKKASATCKACMTCGRSGIFSIYNQFIELATGPPPTY